VVFLHGLAGSWTHWVRNTHALALHHHLLIRDMPDFGESDAVVPTDNIDPLACALIQGIESLIGDQPYHLVGFSFGGLVATRITALAKRRVRRLILMGASGFGLPTSLRLSLQSWRGLSETDQDAAHAHNLRVLM
jgi:pimeloyl-ACP methyl ester carboxylesterase